jgi:hypothetical protein
MAELVGPMVRVSTSGAARIAGLEGAIRLRKAVNEEDSALVRCVVERWAVNVMEADVVTATEQRIALFPAARIFHLRFCRNERLELEANGSRLGSQNEIRDDTRNLPLSHGHGRLIRWS